MPRTSSRSSLSLAVLLPRAALAVGAMPTGAAAAPVLALSRTTIPFGFVAPGFPSPVQAVIATNMGDAPLTITGLALEGAQPGDFMVSPGGTCAAGTALDPGSRCRIELLMVPVSPRGRLVGASVVVRSTAPAGDLPIALNGTVDPALSGAIFPVVPSFLDFPAAPVGATSTTQTITITNATSLPFTVGAFAVVGTDHDDFAMTSSCATDQTLRHGDTCVATISFTPHGAGPRSAELATQLSYFGVDGSYRYSLTGVGGGAAQPATVVEYYNTTLDHYFITWVAAEQANLDAGRTPTRWTRTGATFKVFTSAQAGTSPVCRYYIPPGLGDSHFFGRGTAECDATGAAHPTFVLEDPTFMDVFLPVAGVCPAGTVNVYRVFSNRADANHRYMTDPALRDRMVASGWLAEGDGPDRVVMCAPP